MAERGGFEPPVRLLTVQRFSKPPPSATRPSLQLIDSIGFPHVAAIIFTYPIDFFLRCCYNWRHEYESQKTQAGNRQSRQRGGEDIPQAEDHQEQTQRRHHSRKGLYRLSG